MLRKARVPAGKWSRGISLRVRGHGAGWGCCSAVRRCIRGLVSWDQKAWSRGTDSLEVKACTWGAGCLGVRGHGKVPDMEWGEWPRRFGLRPESRQARGWLAVTGRGPEVWRPGIWAVLNGKVETGSG